MWWSERTDIHSFGFRTTNLIILRHVTHLLSHAFRRQHMFITFNNCLLFQQALAFHISLYLFLLTYSYTWQDKARADLKPININESQSPSVDFSSGLTSVRSQISRKKKTQQNNSTHGCIRTLWKWPFFKLQNQSAYKKQTLTSCNINTRSDTQPSVTVFSSWYPATPFFVCFKC